MPNIITHVLFARELKEKSLSDEQVQKVNFNQALYEIGANGPDFLYFHGVNPKNLKEKSQVRALGTYCHRKEINSFFKSCLNVIRQESDPQVKQDEIAYMMGLLSHWALDSVTHPYIFYRTGSGDTISKFRHHKIESLLDAILLKVKEEKTIKDFKAYKICEVDIDDVRSIARLYVKGAKTVYDTDIKPHQILEALNDWALCQKALYDQSGVKLKCLSNMEEKLHLDGLISAMIIPDKPNDPCDICNLLHETWCHPCDCTKTSTDSFFELYDKALVQAQTAINLFLDCLDNLSKEGDFLTFINNRNYTKGTSNNPPMQYFDPNIEQRGLMLLKEQK